MMLGEAVLLVQSALACRPSGWVYTLEGSYGLEYVYSQRTRISGIISTTSPVSGRGRTP